MRCCRLRQERRKRLSWELGDPWGQRPFFSTMRLLGTKKNPITAIHGLVYDVTKCCLEHVLASSTTLHVQHLFATLYASIFVTLHLQLLQFDEVTKILHFRVSFAGVSLVTCPIHNARSDPPAKRVIPNVAKIFEELQHLMKRCWKHDFHILSLQQFSCCLVTRLIIVAMHH